MAVVVPIPAPPPPHFDLVLDLDDVAYVLELRWNARAEAWFLTVKTAEEEVIAAGRKVVTDFPLWGRLRDDRLPSGHLVAVDTAGASLDASFEDLGSRVQLLYVTAAELAA